MILRPYQLAAVDAVYRHIRSRRDNPCVVIPTAGGKTPIMATICRDVVAKWNGRVIVLAHSRELLAQTAEKISAICPDIPCSIYSAGMKKKERDGQIVVAGIQSAYDSALTLGAANLLLIDEAHMIPENEDSMYQKFIREMKRLNPAVRVVGFTATPYRLDSGVICSRSGVLNHICYQISVKQLIDQGFLCPLISCRGKVEVDSSKLTVRGGEFRDAEDSMLELVQDACKDIVEKTADRKSVIVFCCGVGHSKIVSDTLHSLSGQCCASLDSTSPDRELVLSLFASRQIKYVCNVNILTTGFDAPNIDCVVMLRPTMSAGLYYQMVGRGFRICVDKQNCLVLDYAGNIERHGPIDGIAPAGSKKSNHGRGQSEGHSQRGVNPTHGTKASELDIMGECEELDVVNVFYSVHQKRGHFICSMRVDYFVSAARTVSEWICFEHTGRARDRAAKWWRDRSAEDVPEDSAEAVAIAQRGGISKTLKIAVKRGGKFSRITKYWLGEIPPRMTWSEDQI